MSPDVRPVFLAHVSCVFIPSKSAVLYVYFITSDGVRCDYLYIFNFPLFRTIHKIFIQKYGPGALYRCNKMSTKNFMRVINPFVEFVIVHRNCSLSDRFHLSIVVPYSLQNKNRFFFSSAKQHCIFFHISLYSLC